MASYPSDYARAREQRRYGQAWMFALLLLTFDATLILKVGYRCASSISDRPMAAKPISGCAFPVVKSGRRSKRLAYRSAELAKAGLRLQPRLGQQPANRCALAYADSPPAKSLAAHYDLFTTATAGVAAAVEQARRSRGH